MTEENRIDRAMAQRLKAAAARLVDSGTVTASFAEEKLREIGINIRLSGLSTVQIDVTRPYHAGCAGCLHYDHNPYLQCAVHPLGRPGEVCGDQC